MKSHLLLRFVFGGWCLALFIFLTGATPLPANLLETFSSKGDRTDWLHPGCLVTANSSIGSGAGSGAGKDSNFFAPGLPCLPTPPPSTPPPAPGGTPTSTKGSSRPTKVGPIRLTIQNNSELPFSITLNGPQFYVLNAASGEEKVFVLQRGNYNFTMMLCGLPASGSINFNKMTTLQFKPCTNDRLVNVWFENSSDSRVAVVLKGSNSYVFSLGPGERKSYTIPRGDYDVSYFSCGAAHSGSFEARSERTLELICP